MREKPLKNQTIVYSWMKAIKWDIRGCNFLHVHFSFWHLCMLKGSRKDKRKRNWNICDGIGVKLCNWWHIHSLLPRAVKPTARSYPLLLWQITHLHPNCEAADDTGSLAGCLNLTQERYSVTRLSKAAPTSGW